MNDDFLAEYPDPATAPAALVADTFEEIVGKWADLLESEADDMARRGASAATIRVRDVYDIARTLRGASRLLGQSDGRASA